MNFFLQSLIKSPTFDFSILEEILYRKLSPLFWDNLIVDYSKVSLLANSSGEETKSIPPDSVSWICSVSDLVPVCLDPDYEIGAVVLCFLSDRRPDQIRVKNKIISCEDDYVVIPFFSFLFSQHDSYLIKVTRKKNSSSIQNWRIFLYKKSDRSSELDILNKTANQLLVLSLCRLPFSFCEIDESILKNLICAATKLIEFNDLIFKFLFELAEINSDFKTVLMNIMDQLINQYLHEKESFHRACGLFNRLTPELRNKYSSLIWESFDMEESTIDSNVVITAFFTNNIQL